MVVVLFDVVPEASFVMVSVGTSDFIYTGSGMLDWSNFRLMSDCAQSGASSDIGHVTADGDLTALGNKASSGRGARCLRYIPSIVLQIVDTLGSDAKQLRTLFRLQAVVIAGTAAAHVKMAGLCTSRART